MKQFPPSDCKLGVPMGRTSFGQPTYPLRLFRVNIESGGYDDDGHYWGKGQLLYMATGKDYQAFQRAKTRREAAKLLKITQFLRRKT